MCSVTRRTAFRYRAGTSTRVGLGSHPTGRFEHSNHMGTTLPQPSPGEGSATMPQPAGGDPRVSKQAAEDAARAVWTPAVIELVTLAARVKTAITGQTTEQRLDK